MEVPRDLASQPGRGHVHIFEALGGIPRRQSKDAQFPDTQTDSCQRIQKLWKGRERARDTFVSERL